MQLDAQPSSSGRLSVRVPPTRSDILHPCDVMEDVAIAHGYNNIPQGVGRVDPHQSVVSVVGCVRLCTCRGVVLASQQWSEAKKGATETPTSPAHSFPPPTPRDGSCRSTR